MKSQTLPSFHALLAALPERVRRRAAKAYALFEQNPQHPGLRFKKVGDSPTIYSVRIDRNHRALGAVDGDLILWYWIGGHAEYDKILDQS